MATETLLLLLLLWHATIKLSLLCVALWLDHDLITISSSATRPGPRTGHSPYQWELCRASRRLSGASPKG